MRLFKGGESVSGYHFSNGRLLSLTVAFGAKKNSLDDFILVQAAY